MSRSVGKGRGSAALLAVWMVMSFAVACGGEKAADDAAKPTSTADAGAAADGGEGADGAGAGDAGGASDATPDAAQRVKDKPFPELKTTSVIEDTNPAAKIVEFNLSAKPTKRKVHPSAPELDMYLYNGQFPGPTLRARVGDKVIVHFKNELPEPTTIHWHGLRISDQMDGSPLIQKPIKPGETFTYSFVVPEAGTFWYHPHVRTNEQVGRGLYGALIVEEAENIGFTRDRMFIMDDMLLTKDGFAPFNDKPTGMTAMHGRTGNVLLLNGALLPRPEGSAKKGDVERWRLVNTANARQMIFDIIGPASVRVVGTDGGIIEQSYSIDGKKIALPVGARYDLEVMYYDAGPVTLRQLVYQSGGWQPVAMKVITVADDPSVVDFKTPTLPKALTMGERKVDRTEEMTFDAVQVPGGIMWRINGKGDWKEPIFTFKQGETVIFNIENKAGPGHPFHLHGQFFEILRINGVDPKLPGLKDTVQVPGNSTAKIKAYMDNPGMWMAHCHILEHAELGMMGEFKVIPTAKQ